MSGFMSTGGLAERCARHPWRTVIVWLLVAVLAFFAISRLLGSALSNDTQFTGTPESQKGLELMQERMTGVDKFREVVIVSSQDMSVDDTAFRQQVEQLTGEVRQLGPEQIQSAANYYEVHDESMVSADRHTTIMPVVLTDGDNATVQDNVKHLIDLTHAASDRSGMRVMTTGVASVGVDSNNLAASDMQRMEMFGMVLALIILVVVFGALVAAGLPIVLAILSIIAALGITALVGQKFEMSFFVVNMISMMGMAVGIDYTLFVISRYREELANGRDKYQAIRVAGGTAGRTVLFSGMTVILALCGMLMVPLSIFTSLGAGAIFVVFAAICASLTLLPAILSLIGHRINSVRIPFVHHLAGSRAQNGRFWNGMTHAVMKRPLLSVIAVVALLAVPAAFYFQINTGASGVDTLPDSLETKQAYQVLEQDFSRGLVTPAEVVVDGDVNSGAVGRAISTLQEEVKQDADFNGTPQVRVNETGDLALISLPIAPSPDSAAAVATVERLRQDYVPDAFAGSGTKVYVTGAPGMNADYFSITDRYRPIVFAFVLGLSFLLLMVVFRSLVVPLKAILMNLLSVGAAYGFLVIIFQKGVGASLFGFHQVEAIDAWIPLFLFSVLFGLSMDYHVFLIGRIRERYLETRNNSEAVAFGMRSTGKLITGAAVIMVAVFCGFASGSLAMFQQMGTGLAIAVLLDSTLIRSVLVPASMKLLGDLNWYLPKWLEWLPDMQLEAGKRQPGIVEKPGTIAVETGASS